MQRKLININPSSTQIYLRKLALFSSSYLGNDIYYLKEFVDIIINDIGENRIIELLKTDEGSNRDVNNRIGNNWESIKRKFLHLDVILNRAKGYYDKLQDKNFKNLSHKDNKAFLRMAKKVPLIKNDLFALAVFCIKNTELSRKTITSEAFKILEHLGRKPFKPERRQSFQEIEISQSEGI